jgi:hypothetical protein
MKNLICGAVILAASFLLAACGNSEANKIRGEFIKGCMSTGQEKSLCSCAFGKLEEKYPTEELKRLVDPNTVQVSERFMRDTMNGMLVCAGRPPLPEPKQAPPAASSTPESAPAATDTAASAAPMNSYDYYMPKHLPAGSEDVTVLDQGHPVQLAPGTTGDTSPPAEPLPRP